MSLKLRALSHTKIMSQGLYGGKVGNAFHAAASQEILLEAVRFVIEDIKRAIDQEDSPTIRENFYRIWCDRYLKGAEGVFSDNKAEQRKALEFFFKDKIYDESSFWQEGLLDVYSQPVYTSPEEFESDKNIAKPYRDLAFVFQGSGELNDTELSTLARWSTLSISGKKDRIGLSVRYEFV